MHGFSGKEDATLDAYFLQGFEHNSYNSNFNLFQFQITLVVTYLVFQKTTLHGPSGESSGPIDSKESEPLLLPVPLPKSPRSSGQTGFQSTAIPPKSDYGAL